MSQNKGMELHMSNFNIGDVVRIGKGKVEYVVSKIVNEPNDLGTYAVEVESMNTGKAQVIEAGRLTLLRAAETEPMNATETNMEDVQVSEDVEDFDPREDRRQSAYGLAILAAVMRKNASNPRALAHNSNPLKSVSGKRAKVRNRVRRQRFVANNLSAQYNELLRVSGYRVKAA